VFAWLTTSQSVNVAKGANAKLTNTASTMARTTRRPD